MVEFRRLSFYQQYLCIVVFCVIMMLFELLFCMFQSSHVRIVGEPLPSQLANGKGFYYVWKLVSSKAEIPEIRVTLAP